MIKHISNLSDSVAGSIIASWKLNNGSQKH